KLSSCCFPARHRPNEPAPPAPSWSASGAYRHIVVIVIEDEEIERGAECSETEQDRPPADSTPVVDIGRSRRGRGRRHRRWRRIADRKDATRLPGLTGLLGDGRNRHGCKRGEAKRRA